MSDVTMYYCGKYKLKDVMKDRNLHIVSIEPVEKKTGEIYNIILEKYYILNVKSKNGVINIDDWICCDGMTDEIFAQFQETCRDIRIKHDGKILSTTRLTSLSIFKEDKNGKIIGFFDDDSEWIIKGYILK